MRRRILLVFYFALFCLPVATAQKKSAVADQTLRNVASRADEWLTHGLEATPLVVNGVMYVTGVLVE